MTAALFLAVAFVAFTNGANANFKGVASLYGSGTTSLRRAALWGTFTTFLGSLASIVLAEGILKSFSGRGLVDDSLVASREFVCAVAMGAAFTSFLATRLGFPVSTTHCLIGALLGAGLAGGNVIQLAALGSNFFLPLVVSPLLAAVAGVALYPLFRALGLAPDSRSPLLDGLHVLSAGAASFARGLNDTPKMAALMLAVPGVSASAAILVVGIAIALGGLLDIRRVAETLGKKITGLNPGQGFVASLVTAGLVTTASASHLPVSTTHVSVGALLGIGIVTRNARWRKIGEVLIAWLSTVPCGAALAALAYWILK